MDHRRILAASVAALLGVPSAVIAAPLDPAVATGSVTAEATESVQAPGPRWLPIAASALEVLPGAGHLALGDLKGTGLAIGAVAVPSVLGSLGMPPSLHLDQNKPSQTLPAVEELTQTAQFLSIYHVYDEASDRVGLTDPASPSPSIPDLIAAPFQPAQLLDARVWTAVAFGVLVSNFATSLQPVPASAATPEAPLVFQARSATLFGTPMPGFVGYGANLLASGYVGANAGIGEEALFRGVLQTELERDLGPWPGLIISSSLFGLAHVGGYNQGNPWAVFLGTALGGLVNGRLYQLSGHDLRKPVAAHAYYDFLSFAMDNLHPSVGANNTLGIHYDF